MDIEKCKNTYVTDKRNRFEKCVTDKRNRFLSLTDEDIMKNQYSPDQIEYSIIHDCLSLKILNRYQKLTPYICAKYVIFGGNDEKYGDCSEDRWLADGDILYMQKHITQSELSLAHVFVEEEENREKSEIKNMEKEDIKKNSYGK